ncbi:glycosyltransferase family 2 protein [Thermoleophilia bacterium SCSIO 60948]|nr:glycosyltransferase family 2 protein [Thermoleophilia bacterium SCSIO 60948]
MDGLTWPFEGLNPFLQVWFGFTLVLITVLFCWTATLFVRGLRAARNAPDPVDPGMFRWVFFIPALNEAVTIADSVARLQELDLPERDIVVIDDGSDDATPEVLAKIDDPDLTVLRRDPPHAREGKAEALNYAYRRLGEWIGDHGRERTIVVIVDADGRLHADAPKYAGAHFADPEVGGVQALVRIYNRERPLAWFQDIEFSVFGRLFQAGRNAVGTAGMGGNGQFNRLSALDSITEDPENGGPWRDRLTEDQDLGLRLLIAGWRCHQELRAVVDQQGLGDFRPLLRQRTRWMQGNLQAMGLAGQVWHIPFSRAARIETLFQLLTPIWQALIGLALVASVVLAITGVAAYFADQSVLQLVFFYLLGFGTVVFGCIAAKAQQGHLGWLLGLLIAQFYGFYSWMLWPVLARASARQLTERRDWAKTEREPLAEAGGEAERLPA